MNRMDFHNSFVAGSRTYCAMRVWVCMCLITFAWQVDSDFPLVLAANRDEFYHRATVPARFWEDAPMVLAGRDLQAGGTWMGVTREGRFAVLTNYREPGAPQGERSRGLLVSQYLAGRLSPMAYAEAVAKESTAYSGFNLLVGTRDGLVAVSNRGVEPTQVAPGVHGLSNHLLNTPWPKVEKVKAGMKNSLCMDDVESALLDVMADATPALDAELPSTGVSREMEKMLSSPFIRSAHYGTRVSTILRMGKSRVHFLEQTFNQGEQGECSLFEFDYQ